MYNNNDDKFEFIFLNDPRILFSLFMLFMFLLVLYAGNKERADSLERTIQYEFITKKEELKLCQNKDLTLGYVPQDLNYDNTMEITDEIKNKPIKIGVI